MYSGGNTFDVTVGLGMVNHESKQTKRDKPEEIETDPGAWERFEHAVDAAAKSGPKHRNGFSGTVYYFRNLTGRSA